LKQGHDTTPARTAGLTAAVALLLVPAPAWAELSEPLPVLPALAVLAGLALAAGGIGVLALGRITRRWLPARRAPAPEPDGTGSTPFHRLVSTLADSPPLTDRSHLEVLGAMASAAHAGDHETLGHSFRVARYAVALARRLGLTGEILTALEWGALLHDVGKLAVPSHILHKVGPLTDGELEVMRQHPRHGYQMLAKLVFLGPALDVVLSHHERWDGGGYPNGLAGERIPLAARIFAAVDTYDAITSDRPYRAARRHAEAVLELRRVAGTQLDPRVVDAFALIPAEELERLQNIAVPTLPSATAPALLARRTAYS
jgi:putative nucleotidyltransferase with HDIG domain